MGLTRLLRKSATLPLHAAEAALNTTAAIVTGSVHVATTTTTAVIGAGIGLATLPVRGAAGVAAGLSDVHSARALVTEFVGGAPVRRCSRGPGRAWIEVRGLHDAQPGRAIAELVLSALHARAGVTSAKVNFPLSRVVVSLAADAPTIRELCEIVDAAERQNSAGPADRRLIDLPGDPEVLAGRLVSLAATSAGLCVALAGRALLWGRVPGGVAAAPIVVDYQPRLRRYLENRFGPTVTDTGLAVATAAAYTATQAWSSLAVDLLLQLSKTAESRAHQRAWARHEAHLAAHADEARVFSAARPRPLPPGPVERHGDRSALAQIVGATAIGAPALNLNAAATAALVAAPKASRTARECFASTLARGLSDDDGVLVLRPETLRRLDRVDAVLIDPRALSGGDLRVSRIRGAPDHERAAVWQWAQGRLPSLPIGWNAVGGPWATNGNGRSGVQVFVRRAHHPLASAVIGAARRSGASVVSLDVDELDDLRSTFDDLEPVTGESLDAALADAVTKMQRDGRIVLVLTNSAAQALSAADVAIGVTADGSEPPWYAHLIVDELAGAWRLLHALPSARAASSRGVKISTAASLLGALLMVPGVRGRGPGPVTAGAAAGLWVGYSLARKVIRASAPPPAARDDWHTMSVEQVRRLLPESVDDGGKLPRRSRLLTTARTSAGIIGSVRRTVWEFVTTLRDELSDPLTPVLATGSAASAVLGSPVDAVLVGSVLAFNSALAATQQVRAQRLLRRLLAVQVPPARRVLTDARGARAYTNTEAARLLPGDVIEVRSGEVIPADARLIDVAGLEVDESTLTGESFPVEKQVEATPGAALAERSCMVFAATTVVAGTGRAVVTGVGPQTQVRRAAELPGAERGPVGLQAQLRELTDRAWPVSLAGGGLVTALGLLRRTGLREAIASGVAVAVAAVPEGLALVATLAQQASARRLTRLGALVREPRSVEALGRVDVVCFDKTGTLSENRLRVTKVYAPSGCSRDEVLTCAALSTPSPDANGQHAHATDAAITGAAQTLDREAATVLAHLSFRSGRPFSATVFNEQLTVKGAPEVVLAACADVGPESWRVVRHMAADGLRVIAVAQRTLTPRQTQTACDDPDELSTLCRSGLRFIGLLGLSDTPRAEAAGLLASLAAQDIGVRLITGDHPITAAAIAAELGMPVTADHVITGTEWDALSRRGQEQAVADRRVFARMSPENKVQVVQTLERTGRVCAMVGDGANDAAAIRAATVGIGVASRGGDPARTAADVMLLDGRISSLLDALEEGRKLWLRVQSAVCVLLGGNAGEVAFAIIGSAITGRSPLNTRQLLLVNMLTDALPAAALAVSEPTANGQAARRGPDETTLWRTVGVRGATTAAGATLAWALASVTGRRQRASTVGLVALVATQLGQTLLDSRSPLVVLTAIGSLAAMVALISTPGVSQLLGSTPLGPVGWAQALGSATAATIAAAAISRVLAQRREASAVDRSTISTTPARHNAAYSSHNGMVKARATTSVSGSELTPPDRFDMVSTVTET